MCQRPCNGNALPLAAGQKSATLAHDCVHAFRQAADKIPCARLVQGPFGIGLIQIRRPDEYVAEDAVVKQNIFL